MVWKSKSNRKRQIQVKAGKHCWVFFWFCCKISPSPPLILQCSPILGSSSDQVYNLWYTTCKYRLQFCSNDCFFFLFICSYHAMDEEICATVRFSTKRSGKIKYMEVCVCVFDIVSKHYTRTWILRHAKRVFCFRFLYELQQGSPSHWVFLFGWFNQHMYQYSGVQGRVNGIRRKKRENKT